MRQPIHSKAEEARREPIDRRVRLLRLAQRELGGDDAVGALAVRRVRFRDVLLHPVVRVRIVTRAASRGAPVEPAPQDHSHIEEELSEGDIQGSFAHGI